MCHDAISLVASWFNFFGTCLLAYPALRISRLLKKEDREIRQAQEEPEDLIFWRTKIALSYNKLAAKWKISLHIALIAGTGFIVLGGMLAVWDAYCSQ